MHKGFLKFGSENFYVNEIFTEDVKSAGITSFSDLKMLSEVEQLDKPGLGAHRGRSKFTIGNPEYNVYLKQYFDTPVKTQLKNWFYHKSIKSTAFYDICFSEDLKIIGVDTPEVIAYGYKKKSGIETYSFSLVKEVDKACSLEKNFPSFESIFAKRRFISKLALFARKFHQNGFRHRDFYLCHIFYSPEKDKLTLIDLQRVFKPIFTSLRYRLKDIAQLYYSTSSDKATKTDRLRFYKIYANRNKLTKIDKILIKIINEKALKMLKHDRNNNRQGGYAL